MFIDMGCLGGGGWVVRPHSSFVVEAMLFSLTKNQETHASGPQRTLKQATITDDGDGNRTSQSQHQRRLYGLWADSVQGEMPVLFSELMSLAEDAIPASVQLRSSQPARCLWPSHLPLNERSNFRRGLR